MPRRAARQTPHPSFPRSREPIPGSGTAEADDPPTTAADTAPAEADDPRITSVIPAESLPRTGYGAGIQGGGDGEGLPSSPSPQPSPGPAEADDREAPDSQRGCYDIDQEIARAQRDPAHPIHKWVQAYDEVAATFQGEDTDDVHAWISGEVPDSYGKYIWQYGPAPPRSLRRRPRPRRGRRSRNPGTVAKSESIWLPRPSDKLRQAGAARPNRFKIWV